MPLTVAALYQFVALPDVAALQAPLEALCAELGLTGTLLLAPEGVNGTVAGPAPAIEAFLVALRTGPLFGGRLAELDCKCSQAEAPPFRQLKVRVKREIVTFDDGATDAATGAGTPVAPEAWNALLETPGLLLIDTRNAFEVALGSFPGAVDPGITRFSDFRAYVDGLDPAAHPRVAMFCTGGIRCEKAGAYMRAKGFADVRHLAGGILRYLETVPDSENRWTGDCFVFDGRIALGPALVERPDHAPETLMSESSISKTPISKTPVSKPPISKLKIPETPISETPR
ncbi:rhodanese-like domain-containing protein [Methylobacterium sp. Leaf125]|uniref:oxygen-dependent tRNA uridine(34) hydroxylase TrhO n=1 Tax=Methylobacterium sp. Leaf125 TaxID=1736265 RepID=UPI000ACCA717|nr:rhodanese-like domain-containing protein [Methylobacterium sp. Leaf125]